MTERLRRFLLGACSLALVVPVVIVANAGFPPPGCTSAPGPLTSAWISVIAAASLLFAALGRLPYRPTLLIPAGAVAVIAIWGAGAAASACVLS